MSDLQLQPVSLERMVRAVEKVRERLRRATAALAAAGVPYAIVGGNAVAAWAARIDEAAVRNTPDMTDVDDRGDFSIVDLEALVRMKLTAHRNKDRTHLRDMLEIGLIDETWTSRFVPSLAERLQALIDTPEG